MATAQRSEYRRCVGGMPALAAPRLSPPKARSPAFAGLLHCVNCWFEITAHRLYEALASPLLPFHPHRGPAALGAAGSVPPTATRGATRKAFSSMALSTCLRRIVLTSQESRSLGLPALQSAHSSPTLSGAMHRTTPPCFRRTVARTSAPACSTGACRTPACTNAA